MALQSDFEIDKAFEAESWEFLQEEFEDLATKLLVDVRRGHSPEELKVRVEKHTGRERIAFRVWLAARYLVRTEAERVNES